MNDDRSPTEPPAPRRGRRLRPGFAGALVLLFAACVPYPDAPPPDSGSTTIISGPFPLLDPGAKELQSLHFLVRAYGTDAAAKVADTAERAYNRIMIDTGLYSFKPRGLYELVIYNDAEEYRRKTGQPSWSGGVAVGNAIYSYQNPRLEGTLSHEMTHLIFYEYMGRVNLDHRWVNEGLAVYEESADQGRADLFGAVRGNMRAQPIPMDQMVHLVPATEREYAVSLWYAQAEAMVRFMVERGGRIGFSQFLEALRDGQTFDAAIHKGFPGVWTSLADFEAGWRRSLL